MGVVAAVAIAIAAPYLAPIALGALGIAATTTAVAIATAVIGLTLSIGLALTMRALGVGAPSAKAAVGPPQVFRQSITESFIVYGKRRVGGLLVFYHPRKSGDDHFRYFVIAVAGHRCRGVVSWMLGDEVVTVNSTTNMVTSGKYANNAWLWFVRGTSTDAANSVFVSECGGKWTSAHQGRDVAKIYAKFKLTDEVVQAGMPNITAIIEGRDEVFNPSGAIGYTRNAIRIVYDWLVTPREEGGFGAYSDEIPANSAIAAQAAVCDQTVNSNPRYAFDAVITTGAPPNEIRDVFIVNMAGSYTFTHGKHIILPGYYRPPTVTLSEDDLAGAIQVSPFLSLDSTATEVQGTYISPSDNYQGMPFTTQSVASSDVRQMNLDLAFTTHKDQADRVAAIMLNRAQYEKTVVWPSNIVGLKAQALATAQLDSTRYGLGNYVWTITNWGLSPDWGVVCHLREEHPDIYKNPAVVAPIVPPQLAQPPTVMPLGELQEILRVTYASGLTITSAEAGGSASITFSAFTLQYPSPYGAKSVSGPTTLVGRLPGTVYYPYVDVTEAGDRTPSFGTTTVYGNALNSSANPKRIYLGQSITTPTAGSGGSTGGGGFGGGYGGGDGTVIP